jgi:L-cystine uptake protein TcyP (sodium:dicarboxylate symporter family)
MHKVSVLFNICAKMLEQWAVVFHTDYVTINMVIFEFIWPVLFGGTFISMVYCIVKLHKGTPMGGVAKVLVAMSLVLAAVAVIIGCLGLVYIANQYKNNIK